VVARRYAKPSSNSEGDRTLWEPSGRRLGLEISTVSGHPSVLYWDIPTGIPGNLFQEQQLQAR